jgi:hypothetical protein
MSISPSPFESCFTDRPTDGETFICRSALRWSVVDTSSESETLARGFLRGASALGSGRDDRDLALSSGKASVCEACLLAPLLVVAFSPWGMANSFQFLDREISKDLGPALSNESTYKAESKTRSAE